MNKVFEQISVTELKERALELCVILEMDHYRIQGKSRKDLWFVYQNLIGPIDYDDNCITCLKRMRRTIGSYLKDNPITDEDGKLIDAWKDANLYQEPKKECGC